MTRVTHLQQHAHELVAKHGPRTVAMILHSFTNLGNIVPGATQDEQLEFVAAALADDPRMIKTADNPGLGGDWFGYKEDQSDASGQ